MAGDLEKTTSLTLSRAEVRVRDAMSQGKTPADIARELGNDERFGYAPEEVYAIIQKILNSLDAYTLDQQLKLSILDLRAVAADAKEFYTSTGNAQHLKGMVDALDKAMTHIEHLQSKSEDVLTTIDKKQADMLVRIVERSYDRVVGILSERFPQEDEAELRSLVQGQIRIIAREVDEE